MKPLYNIIFWVAVFGLVLWVGVPFITDVSGLILTDQQLSNFYHSSRYIVVPLAFFATMLKTVKERSAWYVQMRTILLTVGAAVFSVLVFMSGFFDSLCGSTTKGTLFINRQVSSSRIFLREFGCGAASGAETVEIVRIDTVWKIFIKVKDIDTTTIDPNEWIRQSNSFE